MMLSKAMFKEVAAGSDYRVPHATAVAIHRDYHEDPASSISSLNIKYNVPLDAICNIIAGVEELPLKQTAFLMREAGYMNKDIADLQGVSIRSVQRIFAQEG